ncbi:MAG: carbon starvation protein A [Candidatus Omnitrophica bacterium]|nr:carbon starvation protein A [Candidatus Omnitrophota bacterium]
MSTLIFIVTSLIFLTAYFSYGKFLSKTLGIDAKRKTPADTAYDGVDYVPARNSFILFGHHFASIAGAGPIVGPVFAYIYWGWLGALIWIVFGSIFIGAVHDFVSLFISVREGGATIGQIAEKYISRRASIVFLIFLWLALILVIAVFAKFCASSFISEPKIVFPSLGLIPVAIIVGFLIYQKKVNIFAATVVGLIMLTFLIILGNSFPLVITGGNAYIIWLVILFIYSFFASIFPVNVLLQPRDYISSFLLFFGIAVAFVGIVLKPLPLAPSQVFKFSSPIGPIFPMMFITVACGAISGFHSLVSSGTTSKQLAKETDIQKIGYGAMLLEGLLAVIALICVAFGLRSIPQGEPNVIAMFAQGFGRIVFFLGDYAKFIALVIVNAFILTTLDTATRITRFLTQELTGIENKYLTTGIVIAVAGYFCISGSFQLLWPMFGASNQLVAGLALLVASSYLLKQGRNYKITLIPAIAMFIITFVALSVKAQQFFKTGNYLLFSLSIVLTLLGLFIIYEFIKRKKEYAK